MKKEMFEELLGSVLRRWCHFARAEKAVPPDCINSSRVRAIPSGPAFRSVSLTSYRRQYKNAPELGTGQTATQWTSCRAAYHYCANRSWQ